MSSNQGNAPGQQPGQPPKDPNAKQEAPKQSQSGQSGGSAQLSGPKIVPHISPQRNQIFCLLKRERLGGYLGGVSRRKRLIYVRREFESDSSAKYPLPKEYSSILCAGGFAPVGQKGRELIKWNDSNTHFFSEERMKVMKACCHTKQNFRHFSVIIGSLPYFAMILKDNKGKIRIHAVVDYVFEPTKKARSYNCLSIRQFGFHVFVPFSGEIMTSLVYKYDTNHNMPNVLYTAPIGSIYPVFRYEWQTKKEKKPETKTENSNEAQQTLCFGLYYGPQGINYAIGNRYYHRFGEQELKAGAVYELTDIQIKHMINAQNPFPFVALYVCVGAKLLVTDEYNATDKLRRHHNRVLIQNGGIVVCKGSLDVYFPRLPYVPNPSDDWTDDFEHHNWKAFSSQYLKNLDGTNLAKNKIRKIGNMSQMVIFLGATDSKFNSIAWNLWVRRDKNGNSIFRLVVPEWATFTAIEDGVNGLKEIESRLHYEVLHDSVLTDLGEKDIEFNVPEMEMVRKILNIKMDRSYCFYDKDMTESLENSRSFHSKLHRNIFAREFNISMVLDNNLNEELLKKQKSRLAVPPMYPPLLNEDGQVYFLPSQEIQVHDMDSECYSYPNEKLNLKLLGYKCKYIDEDISGYHYTRMTADDEYECLSKTGEMSKDKDFYRLGVDGWMWKKASDSPSIYEENFFVFSRKPKPKRGRYRY